MTEQTAKRWQGFTHEELYRLLHEGPGPQASAAPAHRWAELSAALSDIGQDVLTSLESTGSGWRGRAAGRAYDRLAPLAAWATEASEKAAELRTAVETQADHVARARAEMPAPESAPTQAPDPTIAPAIQIAGAQTDPEPIEAAKTSAEQRAFEVMAAYQQATDTNLGTLTPLDPPVEVLGHGHGNHSHRGQGITMSTHASSAPTTNVIPDRHEFRHTAHGHHHSPHHGGQGVFISGATVSATPARPLAPMTPGALSASVPMDTAVLGAAPRSGAEKSDPEERQARRPVTSAAIGADPTTTGGTSAAPTPMGTGTAAAPMSPAGSAPTSSADKLGLRRFGADALGSSQWFGDPVEQAPSRTVSGRRRDLASTEQVTESVNVDGEDHQLPPGVIGG
ncbi:PPE domain-containing protein [Actinokineospora sp. HUAS TT18]|uniref:PPE domain-containing protein n=1 Tax=Actinokineospora sp. HUAS TT18 TaxID=3447451 RepID=UPI003F527CAD